MNSISHVLFRRLLSSLIVAAVGCLTTVSSRAFSTYASACSSVFGGCKSQSGTQAGVVVTNSGNGPVPGRTYSALADASMGFLLANVAATAEDFGGQDARAIASFDDVVYFNLPKGTTQFDVIIRMMLDGGCNGTPGQSSCFPQISAMAGSGLHTINLDLLAPGIVGGSLTLQAGNNLPISSLLDVRCHARFGQCSASFHGSAYLSSRTEGVSFFSASGHIYSVPEPGTWALMLCGVGLLALRRRWY